MRSSGGGGAGGGAAGGSGGGSAGGSGNSAGGSIKPDPRPQQWGDPHVQPVKDVAQGMTKAVEQATVAKDLKVGVKDLAKDGLAAAKGVAGGVNQTVTGGGDGGSSGGGSSGGAAGGGGGGAAGGGGGNVPKGPTGLKGMNNEQR